MEVEQVANLKTKRTISKLYTWLPIILLFVSVLNEFDFNYLKLEYFSFNFPFILIFFFTLKDFKNFDYLFVFFAGLLNDTVIGLPLGISSLSYTLICIATAYIRNITIRPSPMKDWFYFLFIISLINSINYTVLFLFFSYELDITLFIVNNFFTFLFYIIFSIFFKRYLKSLDD